MTTSPQFASTPRCFAGKLDTANTNRDGTGTIVNLGAAGASGSKVERIVAKADGDPADCTIVFYTFDGSIYYVFDEWDIGNPAAGSSTAASYKEERSYTDLVLPTGYSLRASITATPTAGKVHVTGWGGDL